MTYNKLNDRLKKELLKFIEGIEIDVQQLRSYHIDRNPYCVEPHLVSGSSQSVWDENEEWQEQVKKAKEFIAVDGAGEYLTLADEDWDNQDEKDCTTLTNECINYLSTLEN